MIRFYNAVIVPTVNFTARWISRACFCGALALIVGILTGCSR